MMRPPTIIPEAVNTSNAVSPQAPLSKTSKARP